MSDRKYKIFIIATSMISEKDRLLPLLFEPKEIIDELEAIFVPHEFWNKSDISIFINSSRHAIEERFREIASECDTLIILFIGPIKLESKRVSNSLSFQLICYNRSANQNELLDLTEILISENNTKHIIILDSETFLSPNKTIDVGLEDYYLVLSTKYPEKNQIRSPKKSRIFRNLGLKFTHEFVNTLKSGIKDDPNKYINIRTLFDQLTQNFDKRQLPKPVNDWKGTSGNLPIFFNNEFKAYASDELEIKWSAPIIQLEEKFEKAPLRQMVQNIVYDGNHVGIQNPNLLFGRGQILNLLFRKLKEGSNILLRGPKKIGKTALIQSLLSRDIQLLLNKQFPDAIFVYLNMNSNSLDSPNRLFAAVIDELVKHTDAPFQSRRISWLGIYEYLIKMDKTLVLFFDNYDSLFRNGRYKKQFYNHLKEFASKKRFQAVITHDTDKYYNESESKKAEYFAPGFEELLSFIPESSIRPFFEYPLNILSSRKFEPFEEKLIYLCGRHPYFLTIGRNILFNLINAGLSNEEIIKRVEPEYNKRVLHHYKNMVNSLKPDDRKELLMYLSDQKIQQSFFVNEKMYAFLEEEDGQVSFFSRHFYNYCIYQRFKKFFN